jgi:transcriptional regulator with XRE-family HTH domain
MIDLKNLKTERKAMEMTQIEVAKKVGVSLTTYQLWERGVSKPNEENLVNLKKVFEE